MRGPDELAGTKHACPKCGQRVLLPSTPFPEPIKAVQPKPPTPVADVPELLDLPILLEPEPVPALVVGTDLDKRDAPGPGPDQAGKTVAFWLCVVVGILVLGGGLTWVCMKIGTRGEPPGSNGSGGSSPEGGPSGKEKSQPLAFDQNDVGATLSWFYEVSAPVREDTRNAVADVNRQKALQKELDGLIGKKIAWKFQVSHVGGTEKPDGKVSIFLNLATKQIAPGCRAWCRLHPAYVKESFGSYSVRAEPGPFRVPSAPWVEELRPRHVVTVRGIIARCGGAPLKVTQDDTIMSLAVFLDESEWKVTKD
jgi:hypothetical protein